MAKADQSTIAAALERLAANNGNAKKTARELNISRSTLREWAGRNNAHGKTPSPNLSDSKRSELAEKWRAIADKGTTIAIQALEGIAPADLKMRDVKDLLVGAAVATEKHQLLIGGPTSRPNTQILVSLVAPGGKTYSSLREASLAVLEGEVRELPATIPTPD